MKFLKVFVLFLLLFELTTAFAQHYNFTHIDSNNGLSHNQVNCFLKDSRGFMWLGTASGLNRFDGYNFKIFLNDPKDSTSINHNYIVSISEDPAGRIWVNTRLGLNIYDPATERFYKNYSSILKQYSIEVADILKIVKAKDGAYWFVSSKNGLIRFVPSLHQSFHLLHKPKINYSLASNEITDFAQDVRGDYWLIHKNGILEKLDASTHKVVYRNSELTTIYSDSMNYKLTADRDGDLWIHLSANNQGVYFFNSSKKSLLHIHENAPVVRLNNDIVRGVIEDEKGYIWIGTDHGGINVLDKKDFSIKYILHHEYNEKSLSQNSIYSIYKDNTGIIWVGTFKKGVNYYHENILKFQIFKNIGSNPSSIAYDVNRFAEDEKGNLWLGANGGGLIYFNRSNNTFKQFLSDPDNPEALQCNVIVSLLIDSQKKLWLGTYFGGLYQFDGKKFVQYKNNPSDPSSISSDNIWEIYEDSDKNLWIGTLGGGLDLFDRKRNMFYHYRAGDENSIHNQDIVAILEDRKGNLWLGTSHGIDVREKQSGRFTRYLNNPNDPETISGNRILCFAEDRRGFMWIGTSEGLNLMNQQRKVIRKFTRQEGLPDNNILSVIEDNNGNIWISTPKGLTNIEVKDNIKNAYSFVIKNYNELDGLQGKVFNEDAAFKTKKGELIFGGVNGFNIFRPDAIKVNKIIPPVVFTEFEVFNQVVKPGQRINGRQILEKSIAETHELILRHNENVFSIEFAALNYFHPEKNKYLYKMEGFDKNWISANQNSRRVTYTNLDPGTYTFRVKASNNDGYWNNKGNSLKIIVQPPLWRTSFAIAFYFLITIASLFFARRMIISRAKTKFKIEQERKEALRIHEMDLMKMKFFTNISHEFRTPISLIITPLEKIIKNNKDIEQKGQMELVYRNAKRLLNLVNQLLDFRKMEVEQIKLNLSEGDLIEFIRETTNAFVHLSEKKNIAFSFTSTIQKVNTLFDIDKLEKIMFNLLSNAFKFTHEGGKVEVLISAEECEEVDVKKIIIKVTDTGIGIPVEKQGKIFERFYQDDLPVNLVNQGSGIGLAITKEFVKLMNGIISVESLPEKGSVFTVAFPVKTIHSVRTGTLEEEEEILKQETLVLQGASLQKIKKDLQKQTLLLVEDNEDFRFYLRESLKEYFNISEATNGVQGLDYALEDIPDIIISDVMMPEMNGLEFCKKIRSDARTSHIPVILLTARTAEEQKLEGYKNGAIDYITKPFNFEILLTKINNLIAQRELVRKSFQKHLEIKTSEVEITSLDEKLMKKAIELVEKNIGNAEFSVEELSKEIGMSRVHLYKKLLAITGKSPIEFIRTIRIQRAAQLLAKSQLTVSEIAYQVGFNHPKYFTRYFKTEYEVLPSVYREKFKKSSDI